MDRVLSQFEDVAEMSRDTSEVMAWTAREAGSDRRVVIKRLNHEGNKTRATQALGLRHPHIAATSRWLIDSGYLYVVREWIPGQNLRDAFHSSTERAFDRIRARLDPVLEAVDYAHRQGTPHGAVTPENVIVAPDGQTILADFGTIETYNGARKRYISRDLMTSEGLPTPRSDFYSLCEIYKEFLPERSPDDEAGTEARKRLLRNLTEVQQTAATSDELRYKLDAVSKMAHILGFSSEPSELVDKPCAKIYCVVTPAAPVLNPGAGATIILTVGNEGDLPLQVEAIGSDVVWMNYHTRFKPFTLQSDESRDLIFTLSAARLASGSYNANLMIRSNSGMSGLSPPVGTPWHEQVVAVPVVVSGGKPPPPPPPVERLSLVDKVEDPLATHSIKPLPPAASQSQGLGIACTQEPDPGLVRYGQKGVLHIGVKNIGVERLRIDKITTWPPWLAYPGEFQPLWIEASATQFLGFSVMAEALTAGDYKATVTFMTSIQEPTEMGQRNIWREMKCDVRIRVVKGPEAALLGPTTSGGCATLLLAAASAIGLTCACVTWALK